MSEKKVLRTTQSSIANSVWSIEHIVDGPKFETVSGKKKKFYKVRWSESYELASNIPAELIDIYEKRGKREIKILGPVTDQKDLKGDEEEEESAANQGRPMRLQKAKFAVEIGDDVSIMTYKQVKTLYKDELLTYFEERAKIAQ